MSSPTDGVTPARDPEAQRSLTGARVGWVPFMDDPAVPSVRLRTQIPCAALRRAGIAAEVVPADLPDDRDYDCVVFQKAYEPAQIEYAGRLRGRGVPTVFDICDNHFYVQDESPELVERAARFHAMVERATIVSLSVPALEELVDHPRKMVVDDALEETPISWWARRAARRRHADPRGRVRLVWFGHAGRDRTPAGIPHLAGIIPELEALDRQRPLQLTVISDDEDRYREWIAGAAFPTRYVPWTAQRFGRELAVNDICVLPIEVNDFTRYKTNNRVRTALLLGLPVITTEIPAYREFAEWIRFDDVAANVVALLDDWAAARADVAAAAAYVRSTYTEDRLVAQWSAVIDAARAASA